MKRVELKENPDRMEEGQLVIRILHPDRISAKKYFDIKRSILGLPYTTWEGVKTYDESEISTYVYFHEIKKVRSGVRKVMGEGTENKEWSMEWRPTDPLIFDIPWTGFNTYLDCIPNPMGRMEIVYGGDE